MPPKKLETDETGPDPVLLAAYYDGTLPQVTAWQEAVEHEERVKAEAVAPPICSRLGCPNAAVQVCSYCDAKYCEIHPPTETGPEICDACGTDLNPDNPVKTVYDKAVVLAKRDADLKERELVRQARLRKERRAAERAEREEARKKMVEEDNARTRVLKEELAQVSEQEKIRKKEARAKRLQDVKDNQARLLAEIEAERKAREEYEDPEATDGELELE